LSVRHTPNCEEDFFQRFRDDQEIGRDITEESLDIYFDNALHVGPIVQNRRNTASQAELLDPDYATTVRDCCNHHRTPEHSKRSARDR
jgi:hypothetical protein